MRYTVIRYCQCSEIVRGQDGEVVYTQASRFTLGRVWGEGVDKPCHARTTSSPSLLHTDGTPFVKYIPLETTEDDLTQPHNSGTLNLRPYAPNTYFVRPYHCRWCPMSVQLQFKQTSGVHVHGNSEVQRLIGPQQAIQTANLNLGLSLHVY